jgi:hypothetical protein
MDPSKNEVHLRHRNPEAGIPIGVNEIQQIGLSSLEPKRGENPVQVRNLNGILFLEIGRGRPRKRP